MEAGATLGRNPPLLGVRVSGRRYLFILTVSLGFCAITKGLQVALTPEAWAALHGSGERLLSSSGFGLLLAATAISFLFYCAATAAKAARKG